MSKFLKPHRVEFSKLTQMLDEYERKYQFSTIEFFRRYVAGELVPDQKSFDIYQKVMIDRSDEI
jgi:hypothetical protein